MDYLQRMNRCLMAPLARFSPMNRDTSFYDLNSLSALWFLIINEYEADEGKKIAEYYQSNEEGLSRIQEHIRNIIKGGNEPMFECAPCWGYPILCGCIALIKRKGRLRNLFTEEEHKKMEQLMKMFLYVWNFGCNDNNNYGTGLGLRGNFGKWRGTNYRLSNVTNILFLNSYFDGIDNMNEIVLNFDYDTEIEKLKEYNFTNALSCWTTESFTDDNGNVYSGAKELSMNGGDAYIKVTEYGSTNIYKRGTGVGIRTPIAFKDSIPYGVIHYIYNNCYSGGKCTSSVMIDDLFTASIANGTISPMEGRDGMMLEFNLKDDGLGKRSSLFHCTIDFILQVIIASTLWHLRISKLQVYKNYAKVWVGNEDLIYKVDNGYNGYSLGAPETIDPSKNLCYILCKNYWKVHYNIDPITKE